MNIQITMKKFECSQSTQDEIKKRLNELAERYHLSLTSGRVIMEKENHRYKVEILMFGKFDAKAVCEEHDLELAFEKAYEKIEKQLKKYKDKIKHHKGKGDKYKKLKEVIVAPEGIEEVNAQPKVIEENPYVIKPMSPDEAIMQMELLHKDFYVFLNEEDENLNIVYKREDGNYGLIKK